MSSVRYAENLIDDGQITADGQATDPLVTAEARRGRWIELGWQTIGDPPVGDDERDAGRRRLPELYVTHHRAARILSAVLAVGVTIGTVFWWREAITQFDVPVLVCADCAPPDWFRWTGLIVAVAGIAAAVIQVVYFLNFAVRGVVWRRWRGVAIAFGTLAAAYTLMWWGERLWL